MSNYIVIGLYHGRSWMSKFIQWRTWSPISHASVFSKDLKTVWEAWPKGGVQKNDFWKGPHKSETRIDLFRVYCTEEQAKEIYEYLDGKIGSQYDWKAIVGFVLRIPMEGLVELFCSQLVFDACKESGIALLKRIESFKVSPGDLYVSPLLNYVGTIYTK